MLYIDNYGGYFTPTYDGTNPWSTLLKNNNNLPNSVFDCPSFANAKIKDDGRFYVHYGLNANNIGSNTRATIPDSRPAKIIKIRQPSKTIVALDTLYLAGGTFYGFYSCSEGMGSVGFPHPRHSASIQGGTVNILWADGHASGIKITGNPIDYPSSHDELGTAVYSKSDDPAGEVTFKYWNRL